MGKEIGMGHYTRMSAVGDVFRLMGYQVNIMTSEDEPIAYDTYDIVVLDSYQLSDEYIAGINKQSTLVVCYDDNALYDYDCHMVFNGNLHAENLKFRINEKLTTLYLGGQYTPLREMFWNMKPIKIRDKAKNIFVCFGGSDSNDYTPYVINAIKEILDVNIHVVLGSHTKCDESVYKIVEKQTSNQISVFKNPSEIVTIMQACDIAITGAGSMVYELATQGIPSVLIPQADNQEEIASYLNENKLMTVLEMWNRVQADDIKNSVMTLISDRYKRVEQSKRLQQTVNKTGAKKIVQEVLTTYHDYFG